MSETTKKPRRKRKQEEEEEGGNEKCGLPSKRARRCGNLTWWSNYAWPGQKGGTWANYAKSDQKSTLAAVRARRAKRIGKVLHAIYYNPSEPGSLGSPYRLYKAAKKVDKQVTLSLVHKWLEKQPAYTLHREVVLRFPRRKVIVRGPRIQYQADLMDIQNISAENKRFRYILTVIDCFSRKAAAIPLLVKRSTCVVEALKKAFKFLGGSPLKLQTDQGTEFLNKDVKQLCAEYGIKQFSCYQDVKASIVERFNRTLRTRLQKWQTFACTLGFQDILADVVNAYNNTVHSALRFFSPNSVNSTNEHKVFEIQYRSYLNERAKRKKFKVGDIVRISTFRPRFFKKNVQRNFTASLFRVVDVLDTNPPMYRLVDNSDSEAIEGNFYEHELQRVSFDSSSSSSSSSDDDDDGGGEGGA